MSFFNNAIERLMQAREVEARNYIELYNINFDADHMIFSKNEK